MWCVLYYVCVIAIVHGLDDPIVDTNYGKIRGKWLWSRRNLPIGAFIGIPYAEPPVGDQRFESPKPWSANWTKIRNATEDGSSCFHLYDYNPVGAEDCLFLNVYVPEFPNKTNRPVMAYVHGGDFVSFNSSSDVYSPAYLGDHEVILVTMNYRLAMFGFMSTGTESVPGNNGIKDVREALKWIQKNIRDFNGDPNKVTLFGHGAGGTIVHHLALSQSTEGLFDKYITLSGMASSFHSTHPPNIMRDQYLKIAKQFNCASEDKFDDNIWLVAEKYTDVEKRIAYRKAVEDDVKILNCLKKQNPMSLARSMVYLHAGFWESYPYYDFVPAIEFRSADPVISKPPLLTIKNREYRDIPWMNGLVQDEGLARSKYMLNLVSAKKNFLNDFEKVSGDYMEANLFVSNLTAFSRTLFDYYFPDGVNLTKTSDRSVDSNLTQMTGDGLITWPNYRTLNLQSSGMKSNVYFYYFRYIGTFSLTFDYEKFGSDVFGACHGDDLNFVFPFSTYSYKKLQFHNTTSDCTMVNIMNEFFTSFAKNGVPSAQFLPAWEPYQKDHRFMSIGHGNSTHQVYMDNNFLPERMNFWENVVHNLTNLIQFDPIDEYCTDDYQNTTEYEESTKFSTAIVFQLHLFCITGHLILFIIPAIV